MNLFTAFKVGSMVGNGIEAGINYLRGGGGSSFERHCRMLSQACGVPIIRLDGTSASFRCGGDAEGYFLILMMEGRKAVLSVLSRTEWPRRVPSEVQEAVAQINAKFRRSDWTIATFRRGESNVLARTIADRLDLFTPATFQSCAADLLDNMKKLDEAVQRAGLD